MLSHALVIYDLFQCPHLQVADALWQPTLALAGKTRSHLVYQYRVERPGTPGLDAEVLFGVDVVVVK